MDREDGAPKATILVIDDNEANRSLAQHALDDEGYRVVLASGGHAGIAAFRNDAPDCVLLDVRMPEVDGFAVCEQIRLLPGGAVTPIVFLTAQRDVDTFDRAIRVGADDFLTKPIRPSELVLRVQTALKLRDVRLELREHYALLRRQRDDLTRAQLQRERLMSFVVHDLKNPVNTMDLHAQLQLRDRQISDDVRQSAVMIRSEARKLGRMILNLLDISKADEGKLSARRSSVELRPFVAGIVSELDLGARGRKVRLENAVGPERVHADEDLLQRMLTNLVENAVRHAPPESVVTVTTSAGAGGQEIRIVDAGAGVPVEMRERIFDPFVQVDANTERLLERGSRGLGLAFCKLAAEAHGGRIWVEDGAPGAIFCVWIPYER